MQHIMMQIYARYDVPAIYMHNMQNMHIHAKYAKYAKYALSTPQTRSYQPGSGAYFLIF